MTAAEQYLAHTKDIVRGAFADGEQLGERVGYIAGWRWGWLSGMCCGVAGTVLAAIALHAGGLL